MTIRDSRIRRFLQKEKKLVHNACTSPYVNRLPSKVFVSGFKKTGECQAREFVGTYEDAVD
jgi:hypothetical protein